MSDAVLDLVDSHCHLDRLNLDAYQGDFQAMLDATRAEGVSRMLCIGVDLETFPNVLALAEAHDDVHASVGVHPLYKDSREPDAATLMALADHPRVVAIGETGLDYFYAKQERDWQRRRFIEHIHAARDTGLPLVVHTRGAKDDTLALLREHGQGRVRGVLHCFTEDLDMAEQAMALGFYISISGIVTFRNAEALRETVKQVPMERLLIETDAPWLAPIPHRGKPNEPRFVAHVAECVADLKGVPVAQLARVTRDNFYTLFSKAAV
ncbi:TatD family hydrolase [Alloalcanivorax mobilis]|uniref:TatD family hydrolase n=1 Tax=Alloalcanivorax mobilis TaxID=2019569 RepID=UPI000B5B26A1|nr:TatD family hydrolase [Alloalcanivorax mobilis]ASK34353.1 hydrolase TatD [Alcanivorax sp. N3-2A]|tara:strand:+ start:80472 stop:81269 length:798 start_codon:yes stop_codon:yes gene_type:complete